MHLEGEIRLEFWHSERKLANYIKTAIELTKDDYGEYVIVVPKKQTLKLANNNLEKLHDLFIHEGKLTLKFKMPNVLLYIKDANPEAILAFVAALEQYTQDPENFDAEEFQKSYTPNTKATS